MALEDLTGTKYIDDLNSSNPAAGDNVSEGDDHIRGIKNVLKTTFPSIDGAITATDTELNYVDGVTSNVQTQLDAKLPLAGGEMTGNVNHGDNVHARFGTGNDLDIYHDGSASYIKDSGTGNLKIVTDNLHIKNAADNETKAYFDTNGAVGLYYDNGEKLVTSAVLLNLINSLYRSTKTMTSSNFEYKLPGGIEQSKSCRTPSMQWVSR